MNNGTHAGGRVTKILETAAITQRYTLVKAGSDDTKVQPCGAGEQAIGVAFDEGEVGDLIMVEFFGANDRTCLAPVAMTITTMPLVIAAAGGKITPLPASAGTYEVIGRVIEGAKVSDSGLAEFAPCPHQRVVS